MDDSNLTSGTDPLPGGLKQITDRILSADIDREGLETSIGELYSLFSSLTGMSADADGDEDNAESMLAHGRAISPKLAARCTLDHFRTAQFIRATHAAVLEAQKRFPTQTLEILYAGCGPFAPLVLPLTTRFSLDEIRFTMLDIHQLSLDSVHKITNALRLNDFVRAYIKADATSYKHPAASPLHMVVTETMQAALLNEPQVAIAMNLAPQISEGGIMVPERIVIDASLIDYTFQPRRSGTEKPPKIVLGRVAEITLESCRHLSQQVPVGDQHEESFLPFGLVETPAEATENFYLTLQTTIIVFGQFALGEYESLLTYPIVMHDVGKIRGGMKVGFSYRLGRQPGFKCHLVGDLTVAR
jgi:hypothetical protein